MKRSLLIIGLIAAMLMALSSFASADNKPIRLKMTTLYMTKHPVYKAVYKPWIDEIKKRTKGRVIITYYNPGTIVPTKEILDATIKNQIDIGGNPLAFSPGRFPLATVTNKIPLISTSVIGASMAFWELWKTTPPIQAEFKDLKVLALHHSAAMQLVTKDKAVHKVEEIKGLRLAAVTKSGIVIAKALGASSVFQPPREIYLALSRNMANGVIFPIPLMRSLKVNEATKHTTLFDFNSGPMWVAMNQAKWDSLPQDIKKVFEETTGEVMVKAIGKALDNSVQDDAAIMKKQGMEYITPSAEEKARADAILVPALKNVFFESLKAANSTYADPAGLFNKARDLMKKYDDMYGRK